MAGTEPEEGVQKLRKDGGRTVYLQLVIDTSGSMEEGNRQRLCEQDGQESLSQPAGGQGLACKAMPIPARPLVLDRGACGAVEWQELVRRYRELLLQQRLGLRRFTPVIETSVFGERVTLDPPRPELLASAVPVGVRQGARLAALRDRYPSALVLSCRDTEPPAAP